MSLPVPEIVRTDMPKPSSSSTIQRSVAFATSGLTIKIELRTITTLEQVPTVVKDLDVSNQESNGTFLSRICRRHVHG